jgi:quercetin dioxygenase-like cupin family protein
MLIRTATTARSAAQESYAVTPLVDEDDADGAGAIMIEVLAPGATSPANRTSAETISFLLDGRLSCNGSGKPLSTGDAIFHPPGCVRSFRNIGSEPALLFATRSMTTPKLCATASGAAPKRVSREVADDPSLDRNSGFISMGVRWLATRDTVGTCKITLGTSTFEPGGQHDLHRHPHAVEFLLVVSGSGMHLTEDGEIPLTNGQLVLIPAGEWHGFCTDTDVTTRTVFGYLGAASLPEAGYELKLGGNDD